METRNMCMDDDGLRRVRWVDADMDPEIWGNQKKQYGIRGNELILT